MSILSMMMQEVSHELTWLLPLLSAFILYWFRSRNDSNSEKENVIDLYHIQSRRLYCTDRTFRLLSDDEAKEIEAMRKTGAAIKGRFVDYKEGHKSELWPGHICTVYGYQYILP